MSGAVKIDASELAGADLGQARFVHLRHPGEDNCIRLSRRDPQLKESLVSLVDQGFLVYKYANDGAAVTSFVHASIAPSFWAEKTDFGLREYNGVCYKLEQQQDVVARRLLVVFSCISKVDQMYEAGFSARYFARNLNQAAKYTPFDTAVLRIADLGGVVGAFYTNTNAQPDNEERVAALIAKVALDLAIAPQHIVLYGASKGASGALLHSLRSGMKLVCVEPILSDDYYLHRYRDSHFTQGLFPRSKQALFAHHLAAEGAPAERVVIYSDKSPQFPYIRDIAMQSSRGKDIAFIDVQSPAIKDHPDVAPWSMGLQVALLNLMLCGIDVDDRHLAALRAAHAV
nr:XcbB/CpsF family capsular polysaccharide biosynthesis protein [Xanthomonas sp.]